MRLSCTALSCGSVWPVRHFFCRKPAKKSPAGQTQMDPLCRGRSIQRLYARGATPLRVLIIGRTDPDSYQRSPLLSIKKSLKFREIPWPYSSCIENFPFCFPFVFRESRLYSGNFSGCRICGRAHALFLGIPTNSRQLTYAFTSCHTRPEPFNMPSADHYSCQHTIRLSPARTLCGCPSRFTSASTVCSLFNLVY